MDIVFLFAKGVKTHCNRVTMHIRGDIHAGRGRVASAVAWLYHTQFDSFSLANASLMHHVNQCAPSVLMRTFMHADIIKQSAPENCAIGCTNLNSITDSIVIAHKDIINRVRWLKKIKRNRNVLLADIIDGTPKQESIPYYDGIICCSQKAYDYYSDQYPRIPTYFVAHCIDPRIQSIVPPADHFSAYYFGARKNLLLPNSMESMVNIVYTDTHDVPDATWYEHLSKANFHYAVRPHMEDLVFKPFMKGFVASMCNANLLVHKDDGDALYYLGEDYPYLIKADLTEEVIIRYMKKAQDDFGNEEWNFGLRKIAKLRSCFDSATISQQFWDVVKNYA